MSIQTSDAITLLLWVLGTIGAIQTALFSIGIKHLFNIEGRLSNIETTCKLKTGIHHADA